MQYMGQDEPPVAVAQDIVSRSPVFFDTETTGVKNSDEIIEIAVVDLSGDVLVDSLVKPVGTIPDEAIKIHGISNQMVAGAPTFKELWESQLKKIFAEHPLCIYNAPFDMRMMEQTLALYSIQFQHNPLVLCVMRLFSEFAGIRDQYRGGYKWHKLGKAAAMSGLLLPDSLHRALADSELTRQLLLYLSQQLF